MNTKSIRVSKFTPILLVILVSLLLFEVASKGVLYVVLGIKDDDYARYYLNDPQLNLITWTESYTPHPYFGYESSTLRTAENILAEVGEKDFVIGILGGSVAGSFGAYAIKNHSRLEALRNVLPTFGEKNLRIVNLANGGWKQPQQFIVATYFAEKLDLVINIDGFNDAVPSHLLPLYPLEFPILSAQFYGRATEGAIYTSVGRTARWMYKSITRAALSLPGLSRSSSYFACWHILRNLLYRLVRWSEAAYYANVFESRQSEALRLTPAKEFIQKRIAIWKKYTILEDELVRKRIGKLVFFFLQPNQYLKNSKPLSEQEKQVAFDASQIENIHERMVLLKEAAQALHRSDIPIVDLTAIFSHTYETVYIDSCCHLNDLGNQIMADAIVSHIMSQFAGNASHGNDIAKLSE